MFGLQESLIIKKFKMKGKKMKYFLILTMSMLFSITSFAGRPSFELPELKEGFQCRNVSTEKSGDIYLSNAFQCFEKAKGEKKPKGMIETSLQNVKKAQSNTTDPLLSNVGLFMEGLNHCALMNVNLCSQINCQSLPETLTEMQTTTICGHRKKMYNAFFNIDFENLLINDHHGAKTSKRKNLFETYNSCLSQFLTTKFDNICLSENTNSVQMKNLNSVIEKKIDKELDFLFGDISSPYYALFNKNKLYFALTD